MRNIFYSVLAIGLLLFLQTNIYANSTADCKPIVQIKPVKGNYIPILHGDIATLEKFLLELAEQNANYCKVFLKIDFKEALETKQTITHGNLKYNEKLFLEVQYLSPSYEALIENSDGDILHKIELGKELKSIEYSNPTLENHDALYAEWRKIRKGNFTQIEKDANNFQALIDFLKTENGMSPSENQSLAMNEKKEILAAKGESLEVEKNEIKTPSTRKNKKKKKRKERKKTKAKNKKKEIAKSETPPTQNSSTPKVEEKTNSTTKEAKEESKEIAKIETQSTQKNNTLESKKAESKENKLTDSEKKSTPITSTESEEPNTRQPLKSSEPREIISDDDLFKSVDMVEPLAELVRLEFPYGKNYMVINESDFSIKINTGRENGKIFDDNTLKPKQEKKVKNKFKNGDWYSIVYSEKLHKKDIDDYKKSIKSILSNLKLSEHEDDFFKMSEQLIPNLDIITNENPLTNNSQAEKVEVRFQRFIIEKSIETFKDNQQQEAATQLKSLLTLIAQSHQLHHYYKYTVGNAAAQRPVNKLPRFRKK